MIYIWRSSELLLASTELWASSWWRNANLISLMREHKNNMCTRCGTRVDSNYLSICGLTFMPILMREMSCTHESEIEKSWHDAVSFWDRQSTWSRIGHYEVYSGVASDLLNPRCRPEYPSSLAHHTERHKFGQIMLKKEESITLKSRGQISMIAYCKSIS